VARRFLLLDVDNTLYARSCGVVERIDGRINRYLVEELGIDAAEVDATRRELRREHGTTLRGLMRRDGIDADHYLRFVHAIAVDALLDPAPALAAMLGRIRLDKVAVTNGASAHAHAVLARLGVRECFSRVYALEQLGYVPKPLREAYETVLTDLPAAGAECILVEDSSANLVPARRLGMQTVYVAPPGAPPPEVEPDASIGSILELEAALARLGAA
jgi:putative hydrolase of the HAD superfamily